MAAVSPTASGCACSTTAARSGSMLRVSDEVQPGVVLVPGQRPDGETGSGTVNMLCSDRYTDLGEGATYQSTFLDVAAWIGRRPPPLGVGARSRRLAELERNLFARRRRRARQCGRRVPARGPRPDCVPADLAS